MAIVAALGLLLGIGLDNGLGGGKAQKPNTNGYANGASVDGASHNNGNGNDGNDGYYFTPGNIRVR